MRLIRWFTSGWMQKAAHVEKVLCMETRKPFASVAERLVSLVPCVDKTFSL